MQTTLRIDDDAYRAAKTEAARLGVTLTSFIEQALVERVERVKSESDGIIQDEVAERNELMESLLLSTAHFRIGTKPTRQEMNER